MKYHKVKLLRFLRWCSAVHSHAWFEAEIGGAIVKVRKPVTAENIDLIPKQA